MKTLLILVCVGPVCAAVVTVIGQDKKTDSNEQLIETKYDRFKDETTIKLKAQRIREIAKPREELNLSVETKNKGERALRPKEVFLIFESLSELDFGHF